MTLLEISGPVGAVLPATMLFLSQRRSDWGVVAGSASIPPARVEAVLPAMVQKSILPPIGWISVAKPPPIPCAPCAWLSAIVQFVRLKRAPVIKAVSL